MSVGRDHGAYVGLALLLLGSYAISGVARGQSRLETVTSVRCEFPINAVGAWIDGEPQAEIKKLTRQLVLQFDSINVEDGTASAVGALVGAVDPTHIIVQQSGTNLHFVQILRSGPLYTTTIFDRESRDGKNMAVHTRHEYTDISVPGFTSKPEQYYGDCELTE